MRNIKKQEIAISESMAIFLIGAVQFIDILDFMVVLPLGPDLAAAFNISESQLGWTASAYTLAAAISGLLAALFIDKFERKGALLISLSGLVLSTFAAAFSANFDGLLIARFCAGIFGGPATALSFAIITDLFEPKRRGMAMGKVMSAFSFAAVIGVPFGLELSRHFGWQVPFIATSGLGCLVICLIIFKLPKITVHLDAFDQIQKISLSKLLFNKLNLIGILFASLGMMAIFLIIPYISAFVQANLDFPRKYISLIYIVGGVASFFVMRLTGRVIDQKSSVYTTIIAILIMSITLIGGFVFNGFGVTNVIFVILLFTPFMIGVSIRNVSASTLYSKIPSIQQRAGYMVILSSVQHVAEAVGAWIPTQLLEQGADEKLVNMNMVAYIALALMISVLPLMYMVEKRVRIS